jgi:ferrous iron transport protein B
MTAAPGALPLIALVGNPNTGKTTIFNLLTGLKQKTANYPGVTVEKKIGYCRFEISKREAQILDLPGTYGLLPRSPDEEVVRDVLYSWQKSVKTPDFLLVILDANNLERNLYVALQILEIGIPTLLALNMWDLAESKGLSIDTAIL